MTVKMVSIFVTSAMNLHFFATGKIGMKFGKNINRCLVLNLNRRILNILPLRGDFAPNRHFWVALPFSMSQAYRSGITFFELSKPFT